MDGYREDDDACQLCLIEDATILLNPPDVDSSMWLTACEGCSDGVDELEALGEDWVSAVRLVAGYEF